jgi:hypothetical protein
LRSSLILVAGLCVGGQLAAQSAKIRDASQLDMPAQVDSNSPAWRRNGELHLLNSTGNGPMRSNGADQFHLGTPGPVHINRINPWPTWMESIWVDPDGPIFGWYHQEHFGVCPGTNFSVPQIGAAVSWDGGNSFIDLGTVISSGDLIDCSSQNGYFAGGVGDVSVILDRDQKYFYFYFGNYGGPAESQGVCMARMPYANRFFPAGAVYRYHDGAWNEPGLRGRSTPLLPANVSWQRPDTDAYWGPAIHWNTYLESWVMLLNRSCCASGFPQKGIYISFSNDPGNPESWSKPTRILKDTGWYPQVLGIGHQGTDSVASRVARLYIYGHSRWEIVFKKPEDPPDQQ